MSGQLHTLIALLPREIDPSAHWIGNWVGPRAGLDVMEKKKISNPCQELNAWTLIVQPVASYYTGWATPTLRELPLNNETG
jgi:hypothetical protein